MEIFTYLPALLPILFAVLQCMSTKKYAADSAMASLTLGIIIFIICSVCGPLIPWILVTPPLCVIGLGVLYQPTATVGSHILHWL